MRLLKTLLLSLLVLNLQSCVTGSVLRTARVLQKGQLETSVGFADSQLRGISQVVITAYGITNRFEIEGRLEKAYCSLSPRIQLLKSEDHWIDSLIFFEAGYAMTDDWLGGAGIMFGKRFRDFNPYLAYKYRYLETNIHYIKLGGRYYLPHFWKREPTSQSAWFIGAEFGPTLFFVRDLLWEWAANIGFNF